MCLNQITSISSLISESTFSSTGIFSKYDKCVLIDSDDESGSSAFDGLRYSRCARLRGEFDGESAYESKEKFE